MKSLEQIVRENDLQIVEVSNKTCKALIGFETWEQAELCVSELQKSFQILDPVLAKFRRKEGCKQWVYLDSVYEDFHWWDDEQCEEVHTMGFCEDSNYYAIGIQFFEYELI